MATLDVARSVLSEMISKNLSFVADASYSLPSNELATASGEHFLAISYVLEAMLHHEMQNKFGPKAPHPLQQ